MPIGLAIWFACAALTAVYGMWCRRIPPPWKWDLGNELIAFILLLGWVIVWPVVLVLLVGAHIRRGRKFEHKN